MADQLTRWKCPQCNRTLGRMRLTGDSEAEIKCSCNWYSLITEKGITRVWDGRKEKAA